MARPSRKHLSCFVHVMISGRGQGLLRFMVELLQSPAHEKLYHVVSGHLKLPTTTFTALKLDIKASFICCA